MNKLLILLMVFITSLVFALPEDTKQPIEIEADSVVVDEISGFNEFKGNAIVTQGTLVLTAERIEVQTNNEEVVRLIATGSQQEVARYTQSQPNQARFVDASAEKITYEVDKGIVFLAGNANLIQGFDYFSGETIKYDINNDTVLGEGSEDGTKRVKFKITF